MFCAPRVVSRGTEGIGSNFHVLRAQIHFRWYRGRWVPFSCLGSRTRFRRCRVRRVPFHVLRDRTHFRRYRGRRFPFSCFARPDSFSTVLRASVPFSCFAPPDTFSAVPRVSGPVFVFYAPKLIFGGFEVDVSHFLILRARTRLRRFREHRDPFLCFMLPESFSAVPRASGTVFIFSLLDSFSAVPRASGTVFRFYAPGHVFGVALCVGSRFHVLPARTRFRRYRGRLIP
jgi:hypothetical protein